MLKREITNALNATTASDFNLRHIAPPATGATSTPYVAAPPASGVARPSSADSTFRTEGTYSRRIGHFGNNVYVTFSNNDDIASKKA